MADLRGKSRSAVKRALSLLKREGKVVPTKGDKYAVAGTRPARVAPDDAILAMLAEGSKSSGQIAKATGEEIWVVQRALRTRLIPNHKVIFTSRSTYAVAGTQKPTYVPTRDAILKVLADGKEHAFGQLVTSTGKTPSAEPMALNHLQSERTVIKVRLGVYRLAQHKRAGGKRSVARPQYQAGGNGRQRAKGRDLHRG